ncbi:YczE/YyaS/YitT family protein [Pseudoclavibacter helvolus]|uniref:membrane protein YczE n=1 Tax=Pseudoclavibacter helvolus TaxID=255205 RepID=UPI003C7727F4
MRSIVRLPRRATQLVIGILLYGLAIAMIVRGQLGVSPWDVLTLGIQVQSGLPFGLITVLISVVVLLIWIPLRQRPGFGTLFNALLVGPCADLGLWLIPEDLDLWWRILLLAGGILTLGLATGLYIGALFGPGPRDGLMTGLHRVTGWRIWIVRTALEVTVLAVGWFLGGDVGIGTVAFALLIGPICGVTIRWFTVDTSGARGAGNGPEAEGHAEREVRGNVAPSDPETLPGDSPAS